MRVLSLVESRRRRLVVIEERMKVKCRDDAMDWLSASSAELEARGTRSIKRGRRGNDG